MNRPTRQQLHRVTRQTAAIAAVEAGVDHLETGAGNAGLPLLAIALHMAAATITAVVVAALDRTEHENDDGDDQGHDEPEQPQDDDPGT